jgi:hypothetical protein
MADLPRDPDERLPPSRVVASRVRILLLAALVITTANQALRDPPAAVPVEPARPAPIEWVQPAATGSAAAAAAAQAAAAATEADADQRSATRCGAYAAELAPAD